VGGVGGRYIHEITFSAPIKSSHGHGVCHGRSESGESGGRGTGLIWQDMQMGRTGRSALHMRGASNRSYPSTVSPQATIIAKNTPKSEERMELFITI